MLVKLMKYDLKSLLKNLVPIYLVGIFIGLFNRIALIASDKISLLQVPAGLVTSLWVVLIIGIPFAAFIISIIKYYNSMVKDEGYLTHTLPVKKSSLILSKLFSSFIVMALSLLVSVVVLYAGYTIPSDVINDIINELKKVDGLLIFLLFVTAIIGYFLQMLIIYASIALGQKHSGNKLVYSVVYGLVLYNVNQIISAIFILIPSLFNSDYVKYIEQDNPPIRVLNILLLVSIVISSVLMVVYYVVTTKTLEKKLNLD